MELEFRLGTAMDLEEITTLFEGAKELMISQNILQWDDIYPTKEDYEEDIKNGQLYVGIYDGIIASVFTVNRNCDEQYGNGEWNYSGNRWMTIHRLCVNAKVQNKGIGTATMKEIERLVKHMGTEAIRLDAFTQNPFSLSMYRKLGYKETGFAQWRKGRFYLMEKILI